MRRLTPDRGAVAVMVALLMVPLLACAALVIDVGQLYLDKRRLQNAADASAMAIADDCAASRPACQAMATTATEFAHANAGPTASARSIRDANQVRVTVTSTVNHVFASIIGVSATSVAATSSASWQSPMAGAAPLPVAFSWCAYATQTSGALPTGTTPTTILLAKSQAAGTASAELPRDGAAAAPAAPRPPENNAPAADACTGPTGQRLSGGFGWLKPDSRSCTTTSSTAAARSAADPGPSPPTACSPADFAALQDKTVVLPVFDSAGGTGSQAWYHVYGYAAFHLTGYSLGGQYNWNPPCNSPDRCLSGYFTVVVAPSDSFSGDGAGAGSVTGGGESAGAAAVDLGARLVTLTA